MRHTHLAIRWAALAALGILIGPERASAQPAARTAPLARYFPAKDLVVYAEFDGLDAHELAWKKTAAYRLLTETTTGAMLDATAIQLADRLLAAAPVPNKHVSGKELVGIAKHTLRSGFAFGINRRQGEPKPYCVGLVFRGANRGEVRPAIARFIDGANFPATKAEAVTKPGDRKVIVVADPRGMGFAWWSEGDDLALSLVSPKGADAMIDALDGRVPNATENPLRTALAKDENGFEPVGLAYFDMAALPMLPPQAASYGLDRVKRIDYRWGFQDDALMTVTRLVAPAPRSGILSLLDQPSFSASDLLRLPTGVNGFTMMAFDFDSTLERVLGLVRATNPETNRAFAEVTKAFQQLTGTRLREDLLTQLGPRMIAFTVPSRGVLPTNPLMGFASGLVHVPKTTLLVEVRDSAAFGKTLDLLVSKANQAIRAQLGPRDAGRVGFLPLKEEVRGYFLAVPPEFLPLPAGMRPTILVGKRFLVLGTTPDVARKALALETQAAGAMDAPLAAAVARLPKDMTFMTVSDTRESILPEVVANLPGLIALFASSAGPNQRSVTLSRMMGLPVPPVFETQRPRQAAELRQIDPDLIPSPDDLRPFLFPATYALTANDEGFAFISRESFPSLNPTTALPVLMALGLPAVTASRVAARRSQSVNNLKQIGLGIHNFVSTNDKLPGPVRDKNGKSLLSWRVQILPFMEQQALFNEFHMDEPWDSPHNKALVERMPPTYAIPGEAAEPGTTFYRGIGGSGGVFDSTRQKDLTFASITDGLSNTIAVVEAKEAVPWTKPDTELIFDPKMLNEATGRELLSKLGGHFPGGFNALILDGSVKFIKETVNPRVLQGLATFNGGEVISGDAF